MRFGFTAGTAGLHRVIVRAFAGGTFLGELGLQISVQVGAALEEGPTRTAEMSVPASVSGEVTLLVDRHADQYSFQLIGDALYRVQLSERLAGDPTEAVEALPAELRAMAADQTPYRTPKLVRDRLRRLGAQLWADAVPEVVRRQYWEQAGRISSLSIVSDLDTVPWELLYPVDGDKENGLLSEQFPVVRRVYGQGRVRTLSLSAAAFVVPPGSPSDAMDEVAAVRARLGRAVEDRGVLDSLENLLALLALLESGPRGIVHFACHNAFTTADGSAVTMSDGPFRPSDLALAVQRKALAAGSPLVFFNACRSAGEIPSFTRTMGWAKQFMGAGAGAFLGSLWAVRSSSARDFADAFYGAFMDERQPLGQASLTARKAIADDAGDPTWLAYTVYGSPAATAGGDEHE